MFPWAFILLAFMMTAGFLFFKTGNKLEAAAAFPRLDGLNGFGFVWNAWNAEITACNKRQFQTKNKCVQMRKPADFLSVSGITLISWSQPHWMNPFRANMHKVLQKSICRCFHEKQTPAHNWVCAFFFIF